MRTRFALLGLSLLAALVALPAPAAASDPCDNATTLHANRFVVVGTFTDDCVGVFVGERFIPCFQVEWGVMTSLLGVGGHSGCSAMAYVSPGGSVDILDDLCANPCLALLA